VRCGRCGSENSEGNRFCGMCGATLVAKTQVSAPAPAIPAYKRPDAANSFEESRPPARATRETVVATPPPVTARSPVNAPALSRPIPTAPAAPALAPTAPTNGGAVSNSPAISRPVMSEPVMNESEINEPVINGPSFLGLNKPAYRQSSQSSWDSRTGHDSRSSGNLDYLLDDEEEPKRGWGKLVVIVIALALIGGFGYLRWKQGGFNFLKPTPAAVSAPSSTGSASTPGTAATPDASTPNATPANPAPPPPAATPNPANSGPGNPAPAAPDTAASGAGPAPAAGAPPSGAETNAQPATPPADAAPPQSAAVDNAPPTKPQDNASADKSPAADSEDAEPPKAEARTPLAEAKPSPARTVRERKPSPVAPMDPTVEAERYIYGRGVGQDCDHGLRLLKPAAQANPRAMILLGSLYSSGTCTPRDLPTAYRWFALALHKQPDNQPLQDDLQKLWSQMTQPERQLAIKLSQ
jgi:hypothetical protein